MQGYSGVLRYELRVTRRSFILIAALLFALLAVTLAVPRVFRTPATYGGMSDNAIFPLFIIVVMFRAARKDTQFLVSRPVSRRSIHAAVLTYLAALAIALAIVLAIVQLLGYSVNQWLIKAYPTYYKTESDAMMWKPFYPKDTLSILWSALKIYVATGLFAYGYSCFLTRWKGWTLGISISVPVLLFILFLLPTVRSFMVDVNGLIENGDSLITMVVIPKWLKIIRAIIDWFKRYYDIIYWSVAASMIPLSFFVMRGTRHTASNG